MKQNNTTVSQVNTHIKQYGYELKEERNYFHFEPIQSDMPLLRDSAIFVNNISDLTIRDWQKELQIRINETR